MESEVLVRLSGLILENIAAVMLGVALTLWYIYVKLRLDDYLVNAYKMLASVHTTVGKLHEVRNREQKRVD